MTNEITKDENLTQLQRYVPKGQSPKIYIQLVNEQVMGVDREGNARPLNDLMLFLYAAKRTGLDPLVKQIYPVYRWDNRLGREKMGIQVGIDGMRLVAQRSKEYGGQDDAIFTPIEENGQHPLKATITVYRVNKKTGERMPITASARWAEYVQVGKDGKPMGLWVQMPYNQLSKCAEALALRKAFPNDLSGIYADEEMGQAANKSVLGDIEPPKKKVQETSPKEEETKLEPKEGTPIIPTHGEDANGLKDPAQAMEEAKNGESK